MNSIIVLSIGFIVISCAAVYFLHDESLIDERKDVRVTVIDKDVTKEQIEAVERLKNNKLVL